MKQMFRKLSLLLAILMIVCTPALADTHIANTYIAAGRNVDFNLYSNTVAQRITEGNSVRYVLCDAQGNQLTSEPYLAMDSMQYFWKVAVESGMNNIGLIDGNGNQVMPMEYGVIDVISEKWTIGVVLESATVDQYDYKSSDGSNFYLVSAYDVYFEGAKVGSLERTGYSSAYSYGNYLHVRDHAQNNHFYNCKLEESGYQASSYAGEYDEIYKNGSYSYWHKGTNQQAFVSGCTLTADEVEVSLMEIDGKFYDVQGNIVFEFNQYYDYFRNFEGEYAAFYAHNQYGLIDRSGNIVLPAEYDEIPYFYYPNNRNLTIYFPCGYQAVVKDGKLGYVDLNGNVTCEFKYSAANAQYSQNPNFATLQDLDGSYIVLSAAIGELPEHYVDVDVSYGSWCECIAVQNSEGLIGVLDVNGNEVLPFSDDARSVNNYYFSYDGSMVVLYTTSDTIVYTLEDESASIPEAAAEVAETSEENVLTAEEASALEEAPAAEEAPVVEEAPAADEAPVAEEVEVPAAETDEASEWNCACGAANSGNFCTNCGSARPEEAAPIVCSGCGYQPDAENVPNFCPECGQKFGE